MNSTPYAAAYALDWIAGDPQWMPHPVRFMGTAISWGERIVYRRSGDRDEFLRGAALTAVIVGGSYALARAAIRRGNRPIETALAWTTLATRSLLNESAVVVDAVEQRNLPLARKRLAMIVGRDTASLNEPEILRAVIETLAEGLCDGIVAPLIYLALGGVPLAFGFKALNTMDSMIGHIEPPYTFFGRAAARLDDLANFIPARIAAGAICVASLLVNHRAAPAWRIFRRDGNLHPSPNAGQPEAAMSGALGVRLGGASYYHGQPSPKPTLGAEGRESTITDARTALRIVTIASAVVFAVCWTVLRRRRSRS